jgi:hypothetical protein
VEQTEGTPVEEEEEPITPSLSASKEGKNENNTDKKCCGLNNRVIVESWQ